MKNTKIEEKVSRKINIQQILKTMKSNNKYRKIKIKNLLNNNLIYKEMILKGK